MAEVITRQELEDAKVDALVFGAVLNDPADRDNGANPPGTVTTRTGSILPTLAKALSQIDLLRFYGDTVEGLAAVAEGEFFGVIAEGETAITVYRKVDAAPVEVNSIPNSAAIEALSKVIKGRVTGSQLAKVLTRHRFVLKTMGLTEESLVGSTIYPTDKAIFRIKNPNRFVPLQLAADGSFHAGSVLDDDVPAATATLVWCNSLTDTSFSVAADIEGGGPAITELVVATDPDFHNRVFISRSELPFLTARGPIENYRSVILDAAELKPDTLYYYRVDVAGSAGAVKTVRTLPRHGVATAFSFAHGSCLQYADSYPALRSVKADLPLFNLFIGDMLYPNVEDDDIYQSRELYTRDYRRRPDPEALNASVPIIYMPQNHDMGNPTTHWDEDGYPAGVTHEMVTANARQAYRETVAGYDLVDPTGSCLAFKFDVAHTRFLVLDTISSRRYRKNYVDQATMEADVSQLPFRYARLDSDGSYWRWSGAAWEVSNANAAINTILGRGRDHARFDQMQWLKDELLLAELDGVARVFIVTGDSWGNGGWGSSFTEERAEVCDFIAANTTYPVTILTGDDHYSAAASGASADFSTGQVLGNRLTMGMSSGYYTLGMGAEEPWTFNGVPATHRDSFQTYMLNTVAADGELIMRVKGEPYPDGSTATLLGTYDTATL